LKSKVINMADKTSDAQDRFLESVFHSESIPDDGFSDRIVLTIRRRIWINRLALPVAALIGAAFALKPASQLIVALLPLLNIVPGDMINAPLQFLPQLQMIMLGGMAEQMSMAGGDIANIGAILKDMIDGERNVDKLCDKVGPQGESLIVQILAELGKLEVH